MTQSIVIRDEALRARAIAVISNLPLTVPMRMTLAPYKKSRSSEQNERYWKILTHLAAQVGHTKNDLHAFFAHKFLPVDTRTVMGSEIEVPMSTTKLSVQQFSDYMTAIEAFAVQNGFSVFEEF